MVPTLCYLEQGLQGFVGRAMAPHWVDSDMGIPVLELSPGFWLVTLPPLQLTSHLVLYTTRQRERKDREKKGGKRIRDSFLFVFLKENFNTAP
jgi:hypothetical protein